MNHPAKANEKTNNKTKRILSKWILDGGKNNPPNTEKIYSEKAEKINSTKPNSIKNMFEKINQRKKDENEKIKTDEKIEKPPSEKKISKNSKPKLCNKWKAKAVG